MFMTEAPPRPTDFDTHVSMILNGRRPTPTHLLVGHLYCPIDVKTLGNIQYPVSLLNDCSGLGCGIVASSRDNFLGEINKNVNPNYCRWWFKNVFEQQYIGILYMYTVYH